MNDFESCSKYFFPKYHTLKRKKTAKAKYLPRLKLSFMEKAETRTHTTVAIGLKRDTITGPFLLITHALKHIPPPLTDPPYKKILITMFQHTQMLHTLI